jgi:hypothetical protein
LAQSSMNVASRALDNLAMRFDDSSSLCWNCPVEQLVILDFRLLQFCT